MNLRFLLIFLAAAALLPSCQQQTRQAMRQPGRQLPSGSSVWVGFYNVENLFDTEDDPQKDEIEFLPGTELDWTPEKYLQKLDNLSLAVMAMNNGKGPDLLGLAEVENAQTLDDWTRMSGLKSRGYRYLIEEGPDPRGIDVAFLYDPSLFQYKSHKTFEVVFPQEPGYVSRLILRVDGEINGEPISVIVNHWPSRSGGETESEPRRLAAAKVLVQAIEDRRQEDPNSAFLIMGDFNDDPHNQSVKEILRTEAAIDSVLPEELYNPFAELHNPDSRGTLTYRGKWNLFDQIFLSPNLLDNEGNLEYVLGSAGIHNPDFMQVGGESNSSEMPRRAIYRGEFQERGFSDHFPVFIRLRIP